MTRSAILSPLFRAALAAALTATMLVTTVIAAPAAGARSARETTMAGELVAAVNAERSARGLPGLVRISDSYAQSTAEGLRSSGVLQHYFDLGYYPFGARENIGAVSAAGGASSGKVISLWMSSTGHRAAMLAADADQIAVGVACDGNKLYAALHVVSSSHAVAQRPTSSNPPSTPAVTNAQGGTKCGSAAPAPPSVGDTVALVSGRNIYLSSANATAANTTMLTLGEVPSQVIAGDWNGDGTDTIGYRVGNTFKLLDRSGNVAYSYSYGRSQDFAVAGDWNGDGIDTIGVRRGKVFFLRNSHAGGRADITLSYGWSTDTPVVGDWNGDGIDTFGVRRGNAFYLRNRNSSGVADLTLAYGWDSDTPVVGDWNGDGIDTFGVRRGNRYYLRNRNSSGVADVTFAFGLSSDQPLSGNWDGR